MLSVPAAAKIQCFFHLSFNSTLQSINDISNDLQKLLIYINGTVLAVFFKILSLWFGLDSTIYSLANLASCLKDVKASLFAISTFKLIPSSLK